MADERDDREVALRALSGGTSATSAGVFTARTGGSNCSSVGGTARALARDRDDTDGELVRVSSAATRAGPGTGVAAAAAAGAAAAAAAGAAGGAGVARDECRLSPSAGGCGTRTGITGVGVRELRAEGSSAAARRISSDSR